jgi:hypothetical protein
MNRNLYINAAEVGDWAHRLLRLSGRHVSHRTALPTSVRRLDSVDGFVGYDIADTLRSSISPAAPLLPASTWQCMEGTIDGSTDTMFCCGRQPPGCSLAVAVSWSRSLTIQKGYRTLNRSTCRVCAALHHVHRVTERTSVTAELSDVLISLSF